MVVGASVPDGADSAYDMKEMEHNEAFLRFRLGAGAEGDEAAELLLWPAARPNGQAVVACPGGGFNQVALEREGYPFARWFNERGENPSAELCERLSLELHVTPQTAPAFIVLAEDDAAVSPMHSLRYYEALSARGVPAQLHVYPRGGHSFAFDDAFPYKALWLAELERFLGEV